MAEDNGQAEEILEAVGAVRALDEVHARLGGYFHRREMRERVRRYLVGLLGHVERKNSWQLAEAFGEAGPQGVQRLFTDADWDAEAVRDELRRWLEGQGRNYVLAVPETHGLWSRGHQQTAQHLVAALPPDAWTALSAGAGSQGPRWYDWACLALPYAAAAGMAHWLLARRSRSDPTQLAYYRVYGPADTPVPEMVRVAGRRWTIEEGLEQAKGEVGLDQYEVRRYDAWYRYTTLALLAHAALEITRLSARQGQAQDGKGGERSATATASR